MDPLYANLDKRNSSADQPKPQAPQPTAYSMPNFGQPGTSSVAPTEPIVSSPEPVELAKPASLAEPIASAPAQPIMSAPTEPATPKPVISGSGDIILNIDQPKKKSKGITIAMIIAVACVVCGIAVWVFLQFGKNVKEEITLDEARNRVVDLTSDYIELISAHSRVSSAFLEERIKSNRLIFPAPIGSLESIKDSSARVTDDLLQLNVVINGANQDQLQSINMVKEKADKALAIIAQNNNLLTGYYNAFILPTRNVIVENNKTADCNDKTVEQTELLSSDTKDAAEAYLALYCSAIDMINSGPYDEENFLKQANEAARLLSPYLLEIEDQTQVIDTLQNLKKEMAPNENKE